MLIFLGHLTAPDFSVQYFVVNSFVVKSQGSIFTV